jgi:hypothetical protein
LGGFDVQFRQAGDDVDICWRLIDGGVVIGYAASALVWHHRRSTVRAYLRQQKGYGRSEAMLQFKHPQRFNALGCSRWHGIIYGEGSVGLPLAKPQVYHGRFGSGLFQIIYRHNRYSASAYFTLLEWHVVAAILVALSAAWMPLLAVSGFMWCLTLAAGGGGRPSLPLCRARRRGGAGRPSSCCTCFSRSCGRTTVTCTGWPASGCRGGPISRARRRKRRRR